VTGTGETPATNQVLGEPVYSSHSPAVHSSTVSYRQSENSLANSHNLLIVALNQPISPSRKITPDGTVTTIAGAANQPGTTDGLGSAARFGSGFGGPEGIAVDSSTNIYVADTGNYTVRKITLVGTNWQAKYPNVPSADPPIGPNIISGREHLSCSTRVPRVVSDVSSETLWRKPTPRF